jgi:hypothetical protein
MMCMDYLYNVLLSPQQILIAIMYLLYVCEGVGNVKLFRVCYDYINVGDVCKHC